MNFFKLLFVAFLTVSFDAKAQVRYIVLLKKPITPIQNSNSINSFKFQYQKNLKSFLIANSHIQFKKIEPLWIVNGFSAEVEPNQISQIKKIMDVISITPANRKVHLHDSHFKSYAFDYEQNLKSIKVQDSFKEFPHITGQEVIVGVLDTGVAIQHPDLKNKVILYKNFSPKGPDKPEDPTGHGTHVSGIIAGADKSGKQIGVAPQTQIIFARIFDNSLDSSEELILKGLQWMIDPLQDGSGKFRPKAINASWGSSEPYSDRTPDQEPYCRAFKTLLEFNIIPVASAGNSGSKPGSTNIPGGCPEAFTVGATDNWDRSPWFSSEGPAMWKDQQIIKPTVAAPGMDIKSSVASYFDYEKMSGTSMSTPHVTGAFALLFQKSPSLSAIEAQKIMIDSAQPIGNIIPNNTFGFGRIDVLKMLKSTN